MCCESKCSAEVNFGFLRLNFERTLFYTPKKSSLRRLGTLSLKLRLDVHISMICFINFDEAGNWPLNLEDLANFI